MLISQRGTWKNFVEVGIRITGSRSCLRTGPEYFAPASGWVHRSLAGCSLRRAHPSEAAWLCRCNRADAGLGIAANTTVFTIVNGALLRELPFEGADRIVSLGVRNLGNAQSQGRDCPMPTFRIGAPPSPRSRVSARRQRMGWTCPTTIGQLCACAGRASSWDTLASFGSGQHCVASFFRSGRQAGCCTGRDTRRSGLAYPISLRSEDIGEHYPR